MDKETDGIATEEACTSVFLNSTLANVTSEDVFYSIRQQLTCFK